jgi:hypothetical protein
MSMNHFYSVQHQLLNENQGTTFESNDEKLLVSEHLIDASDDPSRVRQTLES